MSVKIFEQQHHQPSQHQRDIVTLSSAAIKHLKRQLAAQPHIAAIRLATQKSGCSGYKYDVSYSNTISDEDTVIDIDDDLRLVIAPHHLPMFSGCKLDLVKEGINEQLQIQNPNARSYCGCGESFTLEDPTAQT